MSEKMRESLSALMDNEAETFDLRRVVQEIEDDKALRDTWARYHLASSIIHDEAKVPNLDLVSRVRESIAEDINDKSSSDAVVTLESKKSTIPSWWKSLGSGAIAASVTAAIFLGVQSQQSDDVSGLEIAEQSLPEQTPSALIRLEPSTPVNVADADSAAVQDRLNQYLMQHAEHSAYNSGRGIVPYSRLVNFDHQENDQTAPQPDDVEGSQSTD